MRESHLHKGGTRGLGEPRQQSSLQKAHVQWFFPVEENHEKLQAVREQSRSTAERDKQGIKEKKNEKLSSDTFNPKPLSSAIHPHNGKHSGRQVNQVCTTK